MEISHICPVLAQNDRELIYVTRVLFFFPITFKKLLEIVTGKLGLFLARRRVRRIWFAGRQGFINKRIKHQGREIVWHTFLCKSTSSRRSSHLHTHGKWHTETACKGR